MTGVIVQVSISPGGVPNRAIEEAQVTERGIVGDGWRHPQFQGTRKRALLVMTAEGIDDVAAQGLPVYYGALGENLTTRGLDRLALRIGQLFRAGEAVIRLTEVRPACGMLSVHGTAIQSAIYDARALAGDPASPVWPR
ncbi:MAG TPA: MOSC domain-containing protein [Bryobacteraceae bacterium]|nr:MOSC domain-containing protein [Bryobacteraceae bacterium]